MNFVADSARTSLELPYTTLAQRRLAEQIVADDKTLQCERCDFGQEQWLHIFKQSSRGRWYGSRLPCFSFRCTSYSTSNTMLSARSALTASAATEHDNEPLLVKAAKALLAKAACQEAKRPRKSGKGTESKRPKRSGKGICFHARKTSSASATSSDTETPVPTVLPSDDELPVPTVLPSDDDGG